MDIKVVSKTKLTIQDLDKGDIFTWADEHEDVFMIIEGEGITHDCRYKHAVNLRTGEVIEPGTACSILRVAIDRIIATVTY